MLSPEAMDAPVAWMRKATMSRSTKYSPNRHDLIFKILAEEVKL